MKESKQIRKLPKFTNDERQQASQIELFLFFLNLFENNSYEEGD